MLGEDEGVEQLLSCQSQLFKDVAVVGVHRGLHGFVGRHRPAVPLDAAFYRRGAFARDTPLDDEGLGGGIVPQPQAHPALAGGVVDDFFAAHLAQRTSGDAYGDGFDKGGFAAAVGALRVVVPVVAEDEGRDALPECVVQRAESAQVLRFDMF